MLRRVVLATDGSPSALAAARFVAGMGLDPAQVELTLVHVVPRSRAYAARRAAAGATAAGVRAGRRVGGVPSATATAIAPGPAASAAVDATLATLGSLSGGARVHFASGLPAQEIVEHARRTGTDLIVLGKRGQGPTEDLLLGSVCAQVLHTAPCAVLVVGWGSDV